MLEASLAAAPWSPPWPLSARARPLVVLAIIALSVVATEWFAYTPHDADTRLYIALAGEMATAPLARWCAPEWHGHWGREGLFLEHPPGILWAGAALVRAGLPAVAAMLTINAVAWLTSLTLLFRLGYFLGGRPLAVLGTGLYAVTPAFLQYLVRGNHENPLAAAILCGLTAQIVMRGTLRRGLTFGAALTAAVAIKGLAGLALVAIALLYAARYQRDAATFAALTLGVVVAALSVQLFDAWFVGQAGRSFVRAYLAGQVSHSMGGTSLSAKLDNLVYYLARPLWFGSPAILLAVSALAAHLRRRRGRPMVALGTEAPRAETLWLAAAVVLVFVGGYSLADRKADRYLFPMYPALALGAAALALRWPLGPLGRLQPALRRRQAWLGPLAIGLLGVGMAAKVALGLCCYRFVRLWPGA